MIPKRSVHKNVNTAFEIAIKVLHIDVYSNILFLRKLN